MTQLTRDLRVRLSKDQYERIINNLHAKNYKTIASYIRDLALGKGLMTETITVETNKIVKDILEILKNQLK